ncbi:MAG: DUF87 domain-containing protein [Candidatus Jordarchaeales archaeon]
MPFWCLTASDPSAPGSVRRAYGVLGAGGNMTEALEDCRRGLRVLESVLVSVYPQIEYERLTKIQLKEWLTVGEGEEVVAVVGYPKGREDDRWGREQGERGEIFLRSIQESAGLVRAITICEPLCGETATELLKALLGELSYAESTSRYQDGFNIGVAFPSVVGVAAADSLASNLAGSVTRTAGETYTVGGGHTSTVSHSDTWSYGEQYSEGTQHSTSESTSHSQSFSQGVSESLAHNVAQTVSRSISENASWSQSTTSSWQNTFTTGRTTTTSSSTTDTIGWSFSQSTGYTVNVGGGVGGGEIPAYFGAGYGYSQTNSWSLSGSRSVTHGMSESFSESQSRSFGGSMTEGFTRGRGWTDGWSRSEGWTTTTGTSRQWSEGTTMTRGETFGESFNRGWSRSVGGTNGWSDARSEQWSEASSTSLALGRTGGVTGTRGLTSTFSHGVSPYMGINRTWQRMDALRAQYAEVLKRHVKRVHEGISQGLAMTGTFIIGKGCSRVAAGLIAGATSPTMLEPLRMLEPEEDRDYVADAASLCLIPRMRRRHGFGVDRQVYARVLNATEIATMTHLPRAEFLGVEVTREDMPPFRAPIDSQGELVVGCVVDPNTAKPTGHMLRVPVGDFIHMLVVGGTGSGKTNFALNIVRQLAVHGFSVLVLDWKDEWRCLWKDPLVRGRVTLYTLGDEDVAPLRANPFTPPRGVDVYVWSELISTLFAHSFAPWQRVKYTFQRILEQEYAGGSWPTFLTLAERFEEYRARLMAEPHRREMEIEAVDAIVSRLHFFLNKPSLMTESDAVDRIINEAGITVVEAGNLTSGAKKFLLGWLALAVHATRRKRRNRKLIVLEEAHNVLSAGENEWEKGDLRSEDLFNQMFREGRSYGIFLMAISQTPSKLPPDVLGNTPFRAVLRLAETQGHDVELMTRQVVRDPSWDHRTVARWITRMGVGWAIVTPPGRSHRDYEPVQVVAPLVEKEVPSDDEIRGR